MQNEKPLGLSKFQSAVLTQMGIMPWNTRTAQKADNEATTRPTEHKPDTGKLNPLQSLRDSLSHQKQNQTPEAVTNSQTKPPQSLPDKVVVAIEHTSADLGFINDVLLAMGLGEKSLHIASANDDKTAWCDYALLWQYGETISLSNNLLVSPLPSQLQSKVLKQTLWKLVSEHAR